MFRSELLTASASGTAPGLVQATQPLGALRLRSLDVFRGMTIAAMLLVNNPGTWDRVYHPFEHASWNGWTPTDLVFPFFLFIVGVATTFSLGALTGRGATRYRLLRKVALRAVIIFGLGLLLHGFPYYDLSHIRVLGVLQRIALCYLVAAMIVLATGVRGQAAILLGLLLGYWALMTLVPVPGIGHGVLEPDKNLSNWLDLRLIGMNHIWQATKTWDPEGILSTLGAIASVLCGVLAGHWVRSARAAPTKAVGLLSAGSVALALGLIWDYAFPINKSLWTSSYVVFSAGIACLVLAWTYWLLEIKGLRAWAGPFLVFGTNSIAAYWLSSVGGIILDWISIADPSGEGQLVLKSYIYDSLYASWLAPANASLAYAISYVVLWLGLLSILYRRRIFIRI